MKKIIVSFVRYTFNDQSGQILPWIAVVMVGLLGMAGLSIDAGHAFVVRGQLQNVANAAALAAAGAVYNSSSTNNATTVATQYSSASGDQNTNAGFGTITPTITTKCLNILMPSGSTCAGTGNIANAVQVKESATVPTYFMSLFGYPRLTVTAVSTASMQGEPQPWNVAIIMDATGSMSTKDSNCSNVTEFQCAMSGVQTLLQETNPCVGSATSCSGSSALFHVALFGFPEVSTATVGDETGSSSCGSTPGFLIYALPPNNPAATSYAPITYKNGSSQSFTATYEVTYGASDADANGFVTDYYQPSASNGLNSSSSLVKAVTGCMKPISAPGSGTGGLNGASTGGITYYAGVIYAAQAALAAEATLNPGTKNAIIFLSDGQANLVSGTNDMPTSFTANPSSTGLNTMTGTGSYPDTKDECQQAIVAAQAATAAGTRVYGVAYGSEQTGCSSTFGSGNTDSSTVATGNNASFTYQTITPCITIENIASSLAYFYSDYLQSGSGVDTSCVDNSHPVTSLQSIFSAIAATFSKPRLLPNSAS